MPSYQLKRTYQSGYMPPSKRVRREARVNRRLILNKPEIKDIVLNQTIAQLNNGDINATSIFNLILQGAGSSKRVGDKIRVLSITVSGRPFGDVNNASFHMVVPNRATVAPTTADFGSTVGGLYGDSNGWSLMHYMRDTGARNVINVTKRFPLGMLVHYDQPSEAEPDGICTKNAVWAAIVNRTGSNVTNISYSIRIRYTDA